MSCHINAQSFSPGGGGRSGHQPNPTHSVALDPLGCVMQMLAVNVNTGEEAYLPSIEQAISQWNAQQVPRHPFVTIPDSSDRFSFGIADKMKWSSMGVIGSNDTNVLNGKEAPPALAKAFGTVFSGDRLRNALKLHTRIVNYAYKAHARVMDQAAGGFDAVRNMKIPDNETKSFWFGNNNSTGIKAAHVSLVSHKDWASQKLGTRDSQNVNLTGAVVIYQVADELSFNKRDPNSEEDPREITDTNHCRTIAVVHMPRTIKTTGAGIQFGFGSPSNGMLSYLRAVRLAGKNFEIACQNWNSVSGLGDQPPRGTVTATDVNFDLTDADWIDLDSSPLALPGRKEPFMNHLQRSQMVETSIQEIRDQMRDILSNGDKNALADFKRIKRIVHAKLQLQRKLDSMTPEAQAQISKNSSLGKAVTRCGRLDDELRQMVKDRRVRALVKALHHLFRLKTALANKPHLKLHPIGAVVFGSAGLGQETLQTFQKDRILYNPGPVYFNEGAQSVDNYNTQRYSPYAQFSVSKSAVKPRLTRAVLGDMHNNGYDPAKFTQFVGGDQLEDLRKQADILQRSPVYMHNGGQRVLSELRMISDAQMQANSTGPGPLGAQKFALSRPLVERQNNIVELQGPTQQVPTHQV